MAQVCCAAGAIALLSTSKFTSSCSTVMERCGNTCRGVGLNKGYCWACEGVMYEPYENQCPLNSTLLSAFSGNRFYGQAKRNECHGPECAAVFGQTLNIKPKNNRAIRVKALPGLGTATVVPLESIVQFHDNKIPPKSQITGPLTLKCTGHSNRIKVGTGTRISNVDVDCPETCPVHVQLNDRDKKRKTILTDIRLKNNTVDHSCTVIITPGSAVDHPNEFVARGHVSVLQNDGYDVAVANVHGTVVLDSLPDSARNATVTVLETLEDANGRLSLTTTGDITLVNLTAIMDVFSQEYLIGYFGASQEKKREKHRLAKVNWQLAAVLIILLTANASNDLVANWFKEK